MLRAVSQPGQPIVSENAGPFLGGATSARLAPVLPCGASPSQTIDEQNAALQSCGTLDRFSKSSRAECPARFRGHRSNAVQRYDSLQAVLQKRMGNGLEGQVAYTYSKCLTTGGLLRNRLWQHGREQLRRSTRLGEPVRFPQYVWPLLLGPDSAYFHWLCFR